MRWVSTRGGAPPVSFSEALLGSLAPDGGLYVPETLPALGAPPDDLGLPSVARWMLSPFLAGDVLEGALPALVDAAFAFDAPLVPLDPSVSLLELFHGPTAAFKDYAARFLAGALSRLRPGLTILVATSGDTGAAVASAFRGLPGTRVVVLFPGGRVSPRQAHHLGAFGGNVTACAVAGTFDDCQALVKGALADAALRERVPLASANSLSAGRWLPQVVYAGAAALRAVRATGRTPGLVVPTGNLGNATAALLARALGAPIGPVVLATNANRTLSSGFAARRFAPHPTVPTLANAMDVGAPSNLERLTWLHPTPWDAGVSAERVDDDAIRARIEVTWRVHRVAVCPHTATALEAATRRGGGPWIAFATAHPAKFAEIVEPLIGAPLTLPPPLAAALAAPSHTPALAPTPEALRNVLQS